MVAEKKETLVVTTQKHRLEMNRIDIRHALTSAGYEIPHDASIYVHVPGGGDWSNSDLHIDKACPVVVTWETTREEKNND